MIEGLKIFFNFSYKTLQTAKRICVHATLLYRPETLNGDQNNRKNTYKLRALLFSAWAAMLQSSSVFVPSDHFESSSNDSASGPFASAV